MPDLPLTRDHILSPFVVSGELAAEYAKRLAGFRMEMPSIFSNLPPGAELVREYGFKLPGSRNADLGQEEFIGTARILIYRIRDDLIAAFAGLKAQSMRPPFEFEYEDRAFGLISNEEERVTRLVKMLEMMIEA